MDSFPRSRSIEFILHCDIIKSEKALHKRMQMTVQPAQKYIPPSSPLPFRKIVNYSMNGSEAHSVIRKLFPLGRMPFHR
jgi:hypothetical protein